MPKISFSKSHLRQIESQSGVSLMKTLLLAGVPVASSCQGDGVCGKCKVTIESGMENLSSENEAESFLREKMNLKSNQRVSCQIFVLGDIQIDTGYW